MSARHSITSSDWFGVADLARLLNLSGSHVARLIREEQIHAERHGERGRWRVRPTIAYAAVKRWNPKLLKDSGRFVRS